MVKPTTAAMTVRLLLMLGIVVVSVSYHGQRQQRSRRRLDQAYQQAGYDLSVLGHAT